MGCYAYAAFVMNFDLSWQMFWLIVNAKREFFMDVAKRFVSRISFLLFQAFEISVNIFSRFFDLKLLV